MESAVPTPRVSFEFFPPKSLDASFRLWETLRILAPLSPDFVSVTYGAGGSTRDLTQETVALIRRRFDIDVAAHLTCVGAARNQTMAAANGFADAGVTDIVALRGDAPDGAARFTPHPEGFASSVALVEALAATGRFNIRVGAYPERHPEAADAMADVEWLRRKVEAGARSAITQFFFDADLFLRFRDRCAKAGIAAPVIAGILPIQNWTSVTTLAAKCGASIPSPLRDAFEAARGEGETLRVATEACTTLCARLVEEGVMDLHFYTLNNATLTRAVCHDLGVRSVAKMRDVA